MIASRALFRLSLCLGLMAMFLGCGKKAKPGLDIELDVVGSGPFLNAVVEPAEQNGWATIKGKVVFKGAAAPVLAALDVTKDQAHCLAKGPLPDEKLIVNAKNMGVKNVFVWLAPIDADGNLPIHPDLQAPPKSPAIIDQPSCMFVPRALAMRQGQDLVAKNPAPVAHNFHWTGHPLKNPGGNVIMPAGSDYTVKGLVADRFPIKINCDIHPWMVGYVRVFSHPYFAITDADGNFEIKQAPVGKFMLVTWHEDKGWVVGKSPTPGQPITVTTDVTTVPDIQFEP